MRKKKNSRHRLESNSSKTEGPKQVVFNHYIKEMEDKSNQYKGCNKDVSFYLLQSIKNKDKVRDMIFNLAYFYDYNFIGNKDFMHIPNISNILNNCLKYPIMLATKKDIYGNDEIIGATTVKMENNYSTKLNPFFPTCDEEVLTITGVLSKLYHEDENRIHGIGKDLFKSAIKGAYEINKQKKIRLITEIDCRNNNSFNAISKATKELKAEGININLFISGFYEIINRENELTEAPTLILEIDLSGEKSIRNNFIELNYERCRKEFLYKDIASVIKDNTSEIKRFNNRLNENIVSYYKIKPINALNVTIEAGTSAEGNDRVPSINLQLETVNKVL